MNTNNDPIEQALLACWQKHTTATSVAELRHSLKGLINDYQQVLVRGKWVNRIHHEAAEFYWRMREQAAQNRIPDAVCARQLAEQDAQDRALIEAGRAIDNLVILWQMNLRGHTLRSLISQNIQ